MVGDKAKELIMNKIIETLSENYLGTQDKKYYFNSKEDGTTKVVCLSITCPKSVPEFSVSSTAQAAPVNDFDWRDPPSASKSPAQKTAVEISQEELDTVAENVKTT